jgi:hypothetical protein
MIEPNARRRRFGVGRALPACLGLLTLMLTGTSGCSDEAAKPADGGGTLDTGGASPSDATLMTDAVATTGFFPCDVEVVLKAKCHTCHTMPPLMGAPMSLLTWEATQKLASGSATVKIWQRMREYVTSGFMPLAGSPTGPLTPGEKTSLLTWLEAGAQPRPQACQ